MSCLYMSDSIGHYNGLRIQAIWPKHWLSKHLSRCHWLTSPRMPLSSQPVAMDYPYVYIQRIVHQLSEILCLTIVIKRRHLDVAPQL